MRDNAIADMTYEDRIWLYKDAKCELKAKGLSCKEYEEEIKKLVDKYEI